MLEPKRLTFFDTASLELAVHGLESSKTFEKPASSSVAAAEIRLLT